MIVADADALIEYLHGGGGAAADRVAFELDRKALATTSVSVFQLWKGAGTREEQAKVARLLEIVRILPFDAKAAKHAGAAFRDLTAKGSTLGKADLYVAGVCLAEGLALLTPNRRDFERVRGLRFA